MMDPRTQRRSLGGWGLFALVGVLLCFGALNIAVRATWHKLEDGVLWDARPEGVIAADVAPNSTAMASGILPGDLLDCDWRLARRIAGRCADSAEARQCERAARLHRAASGSAPDADRSTPLLRREATRRSTSFLRASVFSRCSSARRYDFVGRPMLRHFISSWLCLAFFGTLTFSFSRLDRLDWYFYWADVVATLLLAPLFLHFTLVFPDRPGSWIKGKGEKFVPLFYLPSIVLFAVHVIAVGRLSLNISLYSRRADGARSARAIVFVVVHDWRPCRPHARDGACPLRNRAPAAPLDCVGHRIWRPAHLRWATRFAIRLRAAGLAADGAVRHSPQPRPARIRVGTESAIG
jgi:hypothetical protein